MSIKLLSVVVPTGGCINRCAFCVSRMRANSDEEDYPNLLEDRTPSIRARAWYEAATRMAYVRGRGCTDLLITGTAEPQQNMPFVDRLCELNQEGGFSPFTNIEFQSTGVGIRTHEQLFKMSSKNRITTFSLSLSSFNDEVNAEYNGTPVKRMVKLDQLCKAIKESGMTLRISVNMTNDFDMYMRTPWAFFKECRYRFNADQVTIRELYGIPDTPEGMWIERNGASPKTIYALEQYVIQHGNFLENMGHGRQRYSVYGMSVIIDNDCMKTKEKTETENNYRYVILRPNAKLYSRWDDRGSLIF